MKRSFAIEALVVLCLFLLSCSKETIDPPTVKVFENAISVSYTKANVSAEVTDQGGAEVKSRGFVYGKTGSAMDTVYCGMGVGVFSAELNNLLPNTSYVYQAFARNAGGVAVSDLLSFVTKDQETPVVMTLEVSDIASSTAVCNGKVTDDKGAEVTARGVCWNTSPNPTMSDSHTESGTGIGEFTCELSGLVGNTTYYVRAYAVNSRGIGYGEELEFVTQDYELPQLTTANVTGITESTASCGGEVTTDGGGTVSERGICWSTDQNPTTDDTHLIGGAGLGLFTCEMTGLMVHTKYYVRAYAVNERGTAYGAEKSFITSSMPPTVTTSGVIDITPTSAKGSGNVTDDGGSQVFDRGVCWGTNHNPTISGSHVTAGEGTGSFTATMSNLTDHTTYYMRAYAVNGVGTVYGDEIEFETPAIYTPVVTTSSITGIGQTVAIAGGNVTDDGGATVSERGICWSTSHNPTIGSNHLASGTGTGGFTVNMTGLTPSTTYYVKAYAVNVKGTSYGEEVSFETESLHLATITTAAVTNVSYTVATCGGNVSNDGGATVSERGICWSTSHNPTISGNHITSGTGTGNFTVNLTGLTPGTAYYVKAYAINVVGTSYGEEMSFETENLHLAAITTADVTNVSYNAATCGGNVSDEGGVPVTSRGICWSRNPNPTLDDDHSNNGGGVGSFTTQMTGLTHGVTYYVRAYAINSVGTNYGEQKTFTTHDVVPPTVTTSDVHTITQTSAKCGGNVTDDGGGPITARGVCWSTSQNPTVYNSTSSDGTGAGSFTSDLVGMNPGTTYYVRAYATNEAGTSYGAQKSLTTAPEGSIIGLYSVSAGQKVYFSKGNLQFRGSDCVWRFADNQYDCIGNANANISSSYDGWIDLFGWGTSGWNCGNTYYHPWDSDNSDGSLYGPVGTNSLVDMYANSDWGHFNGISNGGSVGGVWRTLTREEWTYILTSRNTESGIRYAKASVNGVNGLILVPDDWSVDYYTLNNVNQGNAYYSDNVITYSVWNVMESHGAVFLPTAGWRHGTSVSSVNSYGNYWSASHRNVSNAYYLYFDEAGLYTINSSNRCNGQSVRLVSPAR